VENEERAQLEAQHQKEVDNLKEEVARLTSLLEQALRDKSGKTILIAQPEDMHITHFDPQNLGQIGCQLNFNKLCIFSQHTPQEFHLPLILPRKNLKRARW
jgi:hypothetical protein